MNNKITESVARRQCATKEGLNSQAIKNLPFSKRFPLMRLIEDPYYGVFVYDCGAVALVGDSCRSEYEIKTDGRFMDLEMYSKHIGLIN